MQFCPTRFSKENKESINPYAYQPFGTAPQNFIGMRFALISMKAANCQLLQEFFFRTSKETQVLLKLNSQTILSPSVQGSNWSCSKRNDPQWISTTQYY
uniref:unspecific monooxygenase n=1 Tax=Phascolarctos cinereus TaxID=38626 RepID=A0A6P5JQZ2_PHACI|nr:cytochrome P450 3A19-like [Phascolarctos cinereus]